MPKNRPVLRKDAEPVEVTCVRCLEVKDTTDVDRLLWCVRCRRLARNRAAWWGWVIGLAFAACVAAYIWLIIRPTDLVIGGWIATVVAAAWIGSKVGRELVYGIMRFRNVPALEAEPSTEE